MSGLVSRIEQCIKKKGTNFKQVEQACDLGNGTIKRWSVQSPRLDKLKAVSEYLQLSLDYLVYGENPSDFPCNGLSKLESNLVAMFRLLDDRGREDTFDFVVMQYEKTTGERGSIYSTYTDEEKGLRKSDEKTFSETSSGTA